MSQRGYSPNDKLGHDIWAVERFKDTTHWMIEFIVRQTGDEMRLFLNDEEYQKALACRKIKIQRYAHVDGGYIRCFKPPKKRCHP